MNSEAVVRRCSSKQVLLKISQISQENTCAGVYFKKRLQHWYFPVKFCDCFCMLRPLLFLIYANNFSDDLCSKLFADDRPLLSFIHDVTKSLFEPKSVLAKINECENSMKNEVQSGFKKARSRSTLQQKNKKKFLSFINNI